MDVNILCCAISLTREKIEVTACKFQAWELVQGFENQVSERYDVGAYGERMVYDSTTH